MNTIVEWIASILGEYNPVTYEVYSVAGDTEVINEVIPAGLAGVDWQYIVTALFLLLTVYSVFRLLGVLLQGIGGRR